MFLVEFPLWRELGINIDNLASLLGSINKEFCGSEFLLCPCAWTCNNTLLDVAAKLESDCLFAGEFWILGFGLLSGSCFKLVLELSKDTIWIVALELSLAILDLCFGVEDGRLSSKAWSNWSLLNSNCSNVSDLSPCAYLSWAFIKSSIAAPDLSSTHLFAKNEAYLSLMSLEFRKDFY